MINGAWSVRFCIGKNEMECTILKRYGLQDLKRIIEELKVDVKEEGGTPVSTWILKYIFHLFEKKYKQEGYELVSIIITNKRKINATTP